MALVNLRVAATSGFHFLHVPSFPAVSPSRPSLHPLRSRRAMTLAEAAVKMETAGVALKWFFFIFALRPAELQKYTHLFIGEFPCKPSPSDGSSISIIAVA